MTSRGKKLADQRTWGRTYHDGTARDVASLKTVPIKKWVRTGRFPFWSWKRVTVGHKYYDTDGVEIIMPWSKK